MKQSPVDKDVTRETLNFLLPQTEFLWICVRVPCDVILGSYKNMTSGLTQVGTVFYQKKFEVVLNYLGEKK